MDVKLPNGKVITGIPDGTNKYSIMEKAIKAGLATPEDFGQESAPKERRTWLEEIGRQMHLTGRAAVEGAADFVAPFTEPVRFFTDRALGVQTKPINQYATDTLTEAGVAAPETGVEKLSNFGGRLGTGMAMGRGLDKLVTGAMGLNQTPQPSNVPPSVDELRRSAQLAYQQADDAGVKVSEQAMQRLNRTIAKTIQNEGFNARLHPRIAASLDELANSQNEMSFQQLETLRRVFQNAASSMDKSESRLAQMMVGELDDFMDTLTSISVTQGNSGVASHALRQARSLWRRASEGADIENMIERARVRAPNFSASGLENAIRTEFRQVALNPRRLRRFTPQVQEAIRKVAMGGPIENALRMIGKLAPTGVVSGALSGGAGFAVAGPAGAAGTMGVGSASRLGATAMTLRNARIASELARRGGPPLARQMPIIPGQLSGAVGPVSGLFGQYEEQR